MIAWYLLTAALHTLPHFCSVEAERKPPGRSQEILDSECMFQRNANENLWQVLPEHRVQSWSLPRVLTQCSKHMRKGILFETAIVVELSKAIRVTTTPFRFKGPAPDACADESKMPKNEGARRWTDPLEKPEEETPALAVDLCSHLSCIECSAKQSECKTLFEVIYIRNMFETILLDYEKALVYSTGYHFL